MLLLAFARWEKLYRDFRKSDGDFDVSKIPDLYDCAKFDVVHNPELLHLRPSHLADIFLLSRALAHVVVPQENGCTIEDKVNIGSRVAHNLMAKIDEDLKLAAVEGGGDVPGGETAHRLDPVSAKRAGIKSVDRHVRTRLYFVSESHLYALMNSLRYAHERDGRLPAPSPKTMHTLETVGEIGYLSNVVIRMFEVREADGSRSHVVRVYFSEGVPVDTSEVMELASPAVAERYGKEDGRRAGLMPPTPLLHATSVPAHLGSGEPPALVSQSSAPPSLPPTGAPPLQPPPSRALQRTRAGPSTGSEGGVRHAASAQFAGAGGANNNNAKPHFVKGVFHLHPAAPMIPLWGGSDAPDLGLSEALSLLQVGLSPSAASMPHGIRRYRSGVLRESGSSSMLLSAMEDPPLARTPRGTVPRLLRSRQSSSPSSAPLPLPGGSGSGSGVASPTRAAAVASAASSSSPSASASASSSGAVPKPEPMVVFDVGSGGSA